MKGHTGHAIRYDVKAKHGEVTLFGMDHGYFNDVRERPVPAQALDEDQTKRLLEHPDLDIKTIYAEAEEEESTTKHKRHAHHKH